MNRKNAFYFLVSLFLTSGIALAQQPAPPAPGRAPMALAPHVPGDTPTAFSFLIDGGSFLGVHAEDVNKENMARYGMREARGVGITEVVKESPAEKAGLRKDDVILRSRRRQCDQRPQTHAARFRSRSGSECSADD